jgi:hypothetical protein
MDRAHNEKTTVNRQRAMTSLVRVGALKFHMTVPPRNPACQVEAQIAGSRALGGSPLFRQSYHENLKRVSLTRFDVSLPNRTPPVVNRPLPSCV